jgi:hypothetical protein
MAALGAGRVLILVALLALASAPPGASAADARGESRREAGTAAAVVLSVAFDDGTGARQRATLRCGTGRRQAAGFLSPRDPRRLCAAARRLRPLLARGPVLDRPCTQIYGGPQAARVRGRIGGRSIDRRLTRRNGCEIADWDRARALLPAPRPAR